MHRVFIGFDSHETVAFTVLSHSIQRRASQPVSITPIALPQLSSIFSRPHNPLQSTEFSFSRFLTPYLSEYRGWSLFMDCDMLVLDDIAKLFAMGDDRYAVMCIKHDYVPSEDVKFLNHVQTKYQKKNWSSVILFNNAKCRALTLDYVNKATGLELHQFKWLESESLIGSLPQRWNHLVGVYAQISDPANVHFTIGGPYFQEYENCDYADLWWQEYRDATRADGDFDSLASKHARR